LSTDPVIAEYFVRAGKKPENPKLRLFEELAYWVS
jgi:hypothetical protein